MGATEDTNANDLFDTKGETSDDDKRASKLKHLTRTESGGFSSNEKFILI